jgi:hypothetical protein
LIFHCQVLLIHARFGAIFLGAGTVFLTIEAPLDRRATRFCGPAFFGSHQGLADDQGELLASLVAISALGPMLVSTDDELTALDDAMRQTLQ